MKKMTKRQRMLWNRVSNEIHRRIGKTFKNLNLGVAQATFASMKKYLDEETPDGGGLIISNERIERLIRYTIWQDICVMGLMSLYSMMDHDKCMELTKSFGEFTSPDICIPAYYTAIMTEAIEHGSIEKAIMDEA